MRDGIYFTCNSTVGVDVRADWYNGKVSTFVGLMERDGGLADIREQRLF